MSCPVEGLTLGDEIQITDQLLRSSARILEMNAIRRHISATNGGRLAQRVDEKGAEMINLIVEDLAGAPPTTNPAQPVGFFGTPVAPDQTTLHDARQVLRKYDLLSRAPRSVVELLEADDPAHETPKSLSPRIRHFVLARCADSCEAAKQAASGMGLQGIIVSTFLEGESREAGAFLAAMAKEVAFNQRPIVPPCLLLASGETTTKIEGPAGKGGPSQELALGFALETAGLQGLCIAAIDTDGTDGPTEIAGGIADGTTVERAGRQGLDVYERLQAHDSSTVLTTIGDDIVTGNTGTNVCDLNIIYISSTIRRPT
jgi:glycerate-2-kinase